MTTPSRLRLLFAALLSALLSVALVVPAEAKPRHTYPDRIELPDNFLPEGITIGKAPVAYLGSRADGDIYRADLRTGEGEVISQGPGTPSVGLKIDKKGLLYIAGGPSGTARVVDSRTGDLLAEYPLSTETSFINDVVLTKQAAWFTNSLQAELYRVPLGGDEATPTVIPLTGDWEQVDGFNANGIAQTPNGRALLVVNSTTGNLFRVNPQTGAATQVDLGGASLTNGDGLLLQGSTLYVVRNRLNQVAVVKLNRRATRGRLVETLTSTDFDVPTTVAAYKGSLYLPNARFPDPGEPPPVEFWITRIDK
jgi:sugar lactone lactonase YvrE